MMNRKETYSAKVSFLHEYREVSVSVPSSKSVSHRALIAAALAQGTSVIHDIGHSDDIAATKDALEMLGAGFRENGKDLTVFGTGGKLNISETPLECHQSATTLRFLIPLLALNDHQTVFRGSARLFERPLSVYEDIFALQQLVFEKKADCLVIQGPLSAGSYDVKGNISSQFVSGLLFALPLLQKDSVIHVRGPLESAAYVSLSLDILKQAGIKIVQEGLNFYIRGAQTYRAHEFRIPGDDSQAAVYAALAYLNHTPVEVKNMAHDSKQADHALTDIMKSFGGTVRETDTGYRFEHSELKAVETDLSGCPDLAPVLFALASQAEGTSVFRGCSRLRLKESDRIAAMQEELGKLGVKITSQGDTVRIEGPSKIRGGVILNSHHDHRIVMALSVLASVSELPFHIGGAEAVRKSWPSFFDDLAQAGMCTEYEP